MSLIITRTEVYDPEVYKCICGGIPKHGANHGSGFSGNAYIECSICGLKMNEFSENIGYGDSLLSLYQKVVIRWNRIMSRRN